MKLELLPARGLECLLILSLLQESQAQLNACTLIQTDWLQERVQTVEPEQEESSHLPLPPQATQPQPLLFSETVLFLRELLRLSPTCYIWTAQ